MLSQVELNIAKRCLVSLCTFSIMNDISFKSRIVKHQIKHVCKVQTVSPMIADGHFNILQGFVCVCMGKYAH